VDGEFPDMFARVKVGEALTVDVISAEQTSQTYFTPPSPPRVAVFLRITPIAAAYVGFAPGNVYFFGRKEQAAIRLICEHGAARSETARGGRDIGDVSRRRCVGSVVLAPLAAGARGG
jgi:hypothetical protein